MNQNQNRDEIRAKDLWRAKNGMPQDNGNNKTPGGRKKPPRSLLVFGSILAGLLLLGILLPSSISKGLSAIRTKITISSTSWKISTA